jgi:hypothetical protein
MLVWLEGSETKENPMNAKLIRTITHIIVVFSLSLFCQPPSVWAQTKCKAVKGEDIEVNPTNGNTSTGIITKAGDLNGTAQWVFTAAPVTTISPTSAVFPGEVTIKTRQGTLKLKILVAFDFVAGVAAILGIIDPATSTDKFAGATGALFFNGRVVSSPIPFVTKSDFTGEVCFAN